MKSSLACMAVMFSTAAFGQAIMEHAAAAAGAAIGVGGGKVLSNALDKTLNQAAKTGETAPRVEKPKVAGPPNVVLESPGDGSRLPDPQPAADSPKPARRAARAVRHTDRPVFAASADRYAPLRVQELPLPPPPSVSDFAKLKEGDSRREVLTALGVPSSLVTIPDEGHLVEIMTYQDRSSRRLGTVRLDNGQVVSILTSER